MKRASWVWASLLAGAAAIVFFVTTRQATPPSSGTRSGPTITLPDFSPAALRGARAFEANCSRCHGVNATGTDKGPPLVHDIYNPGHHGDKAIYRAVRMGTPQHHWPFGNMPAQTQVTDKEIADIIRYIRELQEANGIFYRPHRM